MLIRRRGPPLRRGTRSRTRRPSFAPVCLMPDREATQRGRYRTSPHGVAGGHTLPDSEGRTPSGRGSLRGGNEAQGAATVSALATVTRTIQPCNADSSTGRSRLRLILAHLLLGRPFGLGRRLCRSRRLVLPARGQALFEFAHGLTERA